MICVITLYEIDTANIAAFASAFDVDGPWRRISNRLPGHVHTDLLRQATYLLFFLVQDFWESERDYANAERNAEVYSFRQSLRTLVVCQHCMGVFRFRDQWEREQNSGSTFRKLFTLRKWPIN